MRFAGYAAVFDRPDSGGDIIRKGAFRHTIRPGVPLLLQHKVDACIGEVEHLSEDDHGLRVIARLKADTPITPGTGLSFGYRVRKAAQNSYRELTDLDLIEVSIVTHPMQPLARVLAIQNEGECNGL